ncbi:hypothetical protein RA307_01805 [Xanthobacteraceae bacterium Astr-EGSB]|uniref:hypothetical protein n=1 Tax=Astrobacterium formosum TaxID=3069710 RepID=UPI0027B6F9CD|nr:hypothetical protein [Xanthobacteraceae bacterium Astr-EGSB]
MSEVKEEASNQIALQLETRALGEFIANLLGQRRSIERSFQDRRFEIDLNWLINLDQIIEQRLAAQNEAHIVSFSAAFYFANGKILSLESRSDFRSLNDMSNELSVGIDLKWSYLIKFPLNKQPEKQELRFVAFTDKSAVEKKLDNPSSRTFLAFDGEKEKLAYSIGFTDVTWGEDLSSHIANYIVSRTEEISRWKIEIRRIRNVVLFPLATLLGLISMIWGFSSTLPLQSIELSTKYGPLTEVLARLKEPNDKLDFLIEATAARLAIEIPIWQPFGRAILSIVVLSGLFWLAIIRKASFISINNYSQRYLERYGKNYDIIKYSISLALIVGTVASIFASRIYDAIRILL